MLEENDMLNLKERLEKEIERGLDVFDVSGTTVALIRDSEVILQGGYGYADRERGIKMTDKHLLPIGSSSKAFTATGALLLAQDGIIDFDTPLRRYMPRFCLLDSEAFVNATLRDLLCHRTGMPRHDMVWLACPDFSRDHLIYDCLPNLPASKPFRSLWQYNNFMFVAAGKMIEEVTGTTWEEFIRERIFKPLRMNDTVFGAESEKSPLPSSVLYKKDMEGNPCPVISPSVDSIGPAGSIRSNAADMAKWVKFNLSGGELGDKTIEKFHELHKPNIPYDELYSFSTREIKKIGYGLGWFIDSFRGHLNVNHDGNITGASALVSLLPEDGIGCVILTNENYTQMTYALAASFLDILIGDTSGKDWIAYYKDKQEELKKQSKEQTQQFLCMKKGGKKPLHDMQEYTGRYRHPGYGDLEITTDGEKLSIRYHNLERELIHIHYDIFYILPNELPVPVSFKTSIDGTVQSLSIQWEPALEEFIEFKKEIY